MKETRVKVLMPSKAAKIPQKKWWGDVYIATMGTPNWHPIVAEGVFALASQVGTFIVSNKSFASGMMCDLATWQSKYKSELLTILSSMTSGIKIKEEEIEVSTTL